MKVDAITLDLRPRSMFEASDLGVRLVRVHARDVWLAAAPVYAAVVLLALSTITLSHWLPMLLLFWLKPWLDRTVLFVLSRAVFGRATRFADVWAARRELWWSQLGSTLTMRRLSPWRAYVQPALQLEGQTGKARRLRVAQLLSGRRGASFGVQWAFGTLEFALITGLTVAVLWAGGGAADGQPWWRTLSRNGDDAGSVLAVWQTLAYAWAVAVVEPFFVGAGFAMYLNRRVELEAWDVEQEFRLAFAR